MIINPFPPPVLTKTFFNHFIKCPLFLWLAEKEPNLVPKTPELERLFAMGREVDELARQLFAGGVEVGGYNAEGAANTKKTMKTDAAVLFQPTAFYNKRLSARADVMTRNADGSFDIHEVKMGTEVKDENILDVAFQKYVFEKAGVKVKRTHLVYINNEYVRHGRIEAKEIFLSDDVTEAVEDAMAGIEERIEAARVILKLETAPGAAVVGQCPNPKYCEYLEIYARAHPELAAQAGDLPEEHLRQMLDRGIWNAKDVPPEALEKIGYAVEPPFETVNAPAIRRQFEALEYPLYFLDYETFSGPIPPFDGYRPYQQIPFQFSLHVKSSPQAKLEHYEFLARQFVDPVPELLAALKKGIGAKGSVVVWFAPFETSRNAEMGELHPQYAAFLEGVNARVYDLMMVFKGADSPYQKSEFRGSASLKKVLPVLCPELAYDSLAIHGGSQASASWPRLTSASVSESNRAKLARDMLAYCERDTFAMVGLMRRVSENIKMKSPV